MNISRVSALLALAAGALGAACDIATEPIAGNGNVVLETRPGDKVFAVRSVKFASLLKGDCERVTVRLLSKEEATVSVEAESNLAPYIQTEVKKGVLRISLSAPIRPTQPISISATRLGKFPDGAASGPPPFIMQGLGCAADLTVTLSLPQSESREIKQRKVPGSN